MKSFDPMKGVPPFPFLLRGNSGAVWRVTGFTQNEGLKTEGGQRGLPVYKQCDATCVLEGIDAKFGDTTTLYAGSLLQNYGAMLTNGGVIYSIDGQPFGWIGINAVSVKSVEGIKPDAISHQQ